MTICCCLACIEGFGVCSSAPKPNPRSPYIDPRAPYVVFESTANGISSFEPPTRREELQALARLFGANPDNVQPWYEDKI